MYWDQLLRRKLLSIIRCWWEHVDMPFWDRTMCEFRHISSSSIPVKFRRKLVEQLQWCSSIIYIYISVNVLGPFICGAASNFWGTTTEKVLTASFHPMIYTRTLYYVELQKNPGLMYFMLGLLQITHSCLWLHVQMIFYVPCRYSVTPSYFFNTCCIFSSVSLTDFLVCFS